MNSHFNLFVHKISSPIRFGFFLATKLPAAFFVGLKLKQINENNCVIRVKHSWFSKNPFKSVYFAVEAMAAEMCSGMLAFGQVYQRTPKVSMLVVKMEVAFLKKATGVILFSCEDGEMIQNAINEAITSGEGKTIVCKSLGKNSNNDIVAEFNITWSFKAK